MSSKQRRAASEPASPPVEKSDPESAEQPDTLVPDAQVCRELGGISLMTLNRRDNYDPDFPARVKVNGRNYRFRSALEAYKRKLLAVAVRDQKTRIALRQR
jgi:hypothetical protein